jgi:predicted esterase
MKRTILAAFVALAVPALALAQAQTSLSSLRVGYTTRKNTVKPQGELKAQVDAIDQQIAEAARQGRTGELRRLFAKGTTLLSGRQWTPELDFTTSVVLRTQTVVADSSRPFAFRLEQIYAPDIVLDRPLTAHVQLREASNAAQGNQARPGLVVRDLGSFDGVPRDLRDAPFPIEVSVRGVEDGTYQLAVDLADGSRTLGGVSLNVYLRQGLDDLGQRLRATAAEAPAELRADILFPVERMDNVNRGRLELRTFDPQQDFSAASDVASAVKGGANPFARRTGDFKRHYRLEMADEILPYRMYVPRGYDGSRPFPLIVALHGLGGTESSFFDGYEKAFPPLAEQHGYIVAAPLGYRVDGSYGWGVGEPPADPAGRRLQELSEADVMEVLKNVRQQYRIDNNRIYLMGHSMGAIGTWKIAPKYPDIWAAIATISGQGQPDTLARITQVPEYVVHGDNDPTVSVEGSRRMVAKARELGIDVTYVEVPGGTHSSVVAPSFPGIFDFFDKHRKHGAGTGQH